MIVISFIVAIVISLLIGTIFGKYLTKNLLKEELSKGTGNFGIIKYNYNPDQWSSSNSELFIEVEELESAGDLVKVKIVNITPDARYTSHTHSKILENVKFNEWVKKSLITWYDGNSQKRREEKLEKILGGDNRLL